MKERKPIILVDMDGVIANFNAYLVQYAHKKLGAPLLDVCELTNFYTEECYGDEWCKEVAKLSDEEGFFRNLSPVEGAVKALNEMTEYDLRVFICTAPKKFHNNPHCAQEKYQWVDRYLGSKWVEKVVLTRDKTLVFGDILIDDKPEVSGAVKPSWKHVYYDQPYNKENTSKPRILSWKAWKHVILPIVY